MSLELAMELELARAITNPTPYPRCTGGADCYWVQTRSSDRNSAQRPGGPVGTWPSTPNNIARPRDCQSRGHGFQHKDAPRAHSAECKYPNWFITNALQCPPARSHVYPRHLARRCQPVSNDRGTDPISSLRNLRCCPIRGGQMRCGPTPLSQLNTALPTQHRSRPDST